MKGWIQEQPKVGIGCYEIMGALEAMERFWMRDETRMNVGKMVSKGEDSLQSEKPLDD